jgi:hypothetical protein
MIMGTAALRAGNEKIEPSWVRLVQGKVEAMRFGVVQIVVHDSRVVQIERTEKLRLDKSESQANFPGASARGDFQHRFVPPAKETSVNDAPGEDFPADQVTGGNTKP